MKDEGNVTLFFAFDGFGIACGQKLQAGALNGVFHFLNLSIAGKIAPSEPHKTGSGNGPGLWARNLN
jgi:hypothetical protein